MRRRRGTGNPGDQTASPTRQRRGVQPVTPVLLSFSSSDDDNLNAIPEIKTKSNEKNVMLLSDDSYGSESDVKLPENDLAPKEKVEIERNEVIETKEKDETGEVKETDVKEKRRKKVIVKRRKKSEVSKDSFEEPKIQENVENDKSEEEEESAPVKECVVKRLKRKKVLKPKKMSFAVIREKRLLGLKSPSFYLVKDDDMIYHTSLKDTSDGKAYIINTEERIDRFSSTFVGYLKKQESSTRFTLKLPSGSQSAIEHKEELGFYFYHHDNKKREVFIVAPPKDVPYYPATKDVSLSRLAKAMNVPPGFSSYTGHSETPVGGIESTKNMVLMKQDEKEPIIEFFKAGKDVYHINVNREFSPLEAFAFAIACITTKASIK